MAVYQYIILTISFTVFGYLSIVKPLLALDDILDRIDVLTREVKELTEEIKKRGGEVNETGD